MTFFKLSSLIPSYAMMTPEDISSLSLKDLDLVDFILWSFKVLILHEKRGGMLAASSPIKFDLEPLRKVSVICSDIVDSIGF